MKIIAWNINGIKAHLKKDDLFNLIKHQKPDIICMGETKVSCPFINVQDELKERIEGYPHRYWSPCLTRNGYSGTAIFSQKKPLNVFLGMGQEGEDDEGRMITLEFKSYYLVHVYTPNSGEGLVRLDYRVKTWDKNFRNYIKKLEKTKSVIVCGDLNVAREEIDIAKPSNNKRNAGFTDEERNSFEKLLDETTLIDTFREKHPKTIKYSFWTYFHQARAKNIGWRIDYFLVSKKLLPKIKDSEILTDVLGSDHAPIVLTH
jgi:exodeoxyribonuclease III